MRSNTTLLAFLLTSFIFLVACNDYVKYEESNFYTEEEWDTISQDLNLPAILDDYGNQTISFSSQPILNNSNRNMLATLGRVLFYDKDLSSDGKISCASCHQQHLAFGDDVSFSSGVHGNLTQRNSIALGSLRSFDDEYGEGEEFVPGLFWDERAPSVKAQMEQTFANPDEMGMDITQLKDIVETKPYYQTLFQITDFNKEFGNINSSDGNKITTDNILTAIEVFIRTLSTTQSKFDKIGFDEAALFTSGGFKSDWQGFSESENRGKLLFSENCGACHGRTLVPSGFRDNTNQFDILNPKSIANNGLDKTYSDKGVGSFSKLEEDNGKFKIPALKNIALSAPYMHDGRFETLSEVIDFYSESLQDHPNLDEDLKDENGNAKRLNFDQQDKDDLLSFLNTLTDNNMAIDSKWSDPFKK